MKYIFSEENAPLIMSEHGQAKVVSCDFSRTIESDKVGVLGVYVVFSVIDHGWNKSNFMGGVWGLSFMQQLLNHPAVVPDYIERGLSDID